jgi:hypothetical protein
LAKEFNLTSAAGTGIKSSQVFDPHNSKSSQRMQAKNCVCACRALWCCSSGFSASGWAGIRIIPLSFLSLIVAADSLLWNG